MRKFNTTGPCFPDEHYMLPALDRLPGIRELVAGGNYFVVHAPRLEVSFRNGERGVFDCNPYRNYECLSGIWAEGVFDKVVADHGTVMWPNGADLCPDEVYENSTKIGALK